MMCAMNWPLQSEVPAFYGRNIAVKKGVPGPDPKWEKENLEYIAVPWRMVAAWDTGQRVKAFRVHRLCADDLEIILGEIWSEFGKRQAEIERVRMHLYGGGYAWRMMRGASRLSMHSYGCALDFDPAHNGFGDPSPDMSPVVVSVFEAHGWVWGGRWSASHRDGMHFQAARV